MLYLGVSQRVILLASAAAVTAGLVPAQQVVGANGFSSGSLPAAGPQLLQQPQTTQAPALSKEMRADIMMARKMYREAIDLYKEAPQDSPIIMNKIGIAYHQLTELNMARRYYERAAKMDPSYPEAVNNLGTVFYAQKNYRRAITQYKKALELKPDGASMHMNLGTAYFARKNYDLALACYQEALRHDPDVFEHRGTNGTTLQERSVEERAKFHFYMAKTYAKAGNVERSLLYLRKALEEGFKDRDKILQGPEFAAMLELAEFKQIMSAEYKVL